LEKKGVKVSKPMHWAQMQVYMLGTKIERALYVAVCKDDDRIYTERVKYDRSRQELTRSRTAHRHDRTHPCADINRRKLVSMQVLPGA
jgi:hypothetical protein